MGSKITLEEAKQRVFEAHGNQIKIVEETYKNSTVKCQFIDEKYGEWSVSPQSVFAGHEHPLRGLENSIKSLEEAKKQIFLVHGNQVKIVEETYISFCKKCEFEDIDFGKWISTPNRLCSRKNSHPKRGNLKQSLTCQNRTKEQREKLNYKSLNLLSLEKIKKRIFNIHGDQVKIVEETYVNASTKCDFIDIDYGKWTAVPKTIYSGVSHKLRGKEKIDFKFSAFLAHQTKKRNGSYGKSIQEDKFYEFLLTVFEPNDIERQYRINKQAIDFYIKSKQLFIQFDGEYWHGLQKSIEEMQIKTNPQAISNLKTYYKDREQDQWFKENNLNLIRITNKQFQKDLENMKLKILAI